MAIFKLQAAMAMGLFLVFVAFVLLVAFIVLLIVFTSIAVSRKKRNGEAMNIKSYALAFGGGLLKSVLIVGGVTLLLILLLSQCDMSLN